MEKKIKSMQYDVEIMNSILNYLAKRPYQEVAELIAVIQTKGFPIYEEEPTKEK